MQLNIVQHNLAECIAVCITQRIQLNVIECTTRCDDNINCTTLLRIMQCNTIHLSTLQCALRNRIQLNASHNAMLIFTDAPPCGQCNSMQCNTIWLDAAHTVIQLNAAL